MFLSHFAVGIASKRFAPRAPLAWLLAAPMLADIIWPVLVLAGAERVRITQDANPFHVLQFDSYPWSHSLLMDLAWGVILGLIVGRFWGKRAGVVVAAGVVSHWVLDWISHRPDVPLVPGGRRYGLDLWSSPAGTLAFELVMLAIGVWLFATATRPVDRTGRWAFVGLVAFMLLVYLGATYGPPPTSDTAIAVSAALLAVIVIPWAWWIDSHRTVRQRIPEAAPAA